MALKTHRLMAPQINGDCSADPGAAHAVNAKRKLCGHMINEALKKLFHDADALC